MHLGSSLRVNLKVVNDLCHNDTVCIKIPSHYFTIKHLVKENNQL